MAATPRSNNSSVVPDADDAFAGAGGFIPPRITAIPSPAPTTGSTRAAAGLPHPRSKPLARGSRKEEYARNYVSQRLMHISRRFVKKHGIPHPEDEVTGYESMDEVCHDLDDVVDVLWFSGTPSIQIPYLINVAAAFKDYLPSFPPSPHPTFALLKKLDHCFASLLVGKDVKSDQPLPGFQRGLSAGFSKTDMVRIKSLADDTRMQVAVTMSGEADVFDFDAVEEEGPAGTVRRFRHREGGLRDAMAAGAEPSGADDTNDDEDDDGDFVDVPGPSAPSAPGKRKTHPEDMNGYGDNDDDDDDDRQTTHTDDTLDFKRIKIEDADADPTITDWQPAGMIKSEDRMEDDQAWPSSPRASFEPGDEDRKPDVSPGGGRPSNSNNQGKFQWAIDEDSDSDTEADTKDTATRTSSGAAQANVDAGPSTSSRPRHAPSQGGRPYSPHGDPDIVPSDREEEEEDGDEESEEEEEMHLNVAQVYEKTLVQLGQSLGESLVDD